MKKNNGLFGALLFLFCIFGSTGCINEEKEEKKVTHYEERSGGIQTAFFCRHFACPALNHCKAIRQILIRMPRSLWGAHTFYITLDQSLLRSQQMVPYENKNLAQNFVLCYENIMFALHNK